MILNTKNTSGKDGLYFKSKNCVIAPPELNSRVFQKGTAFEMLEPCAGKLACTVLRGLGAGNSSRLPDENSTFFIEIDHNIWVEIFCRIFEKSSDSYEPVEKPVLTNLIP